MGRREDPRQLELSFEVPRPAPAEPGALDCDGAVREALAETIRTSDMARADIAARMSALSGRQVSEHMLNAWTAPSRTSWRFPLALAPAFEVATSSYSLLERLAAWRGCRVLVGEEALQAEWGRLEQMRQDINAQMTSLRARMRKRA